MEQPRILCIAGPTACHKTELSIQLAKAYGGEIVSADSVQVYIGMDVGSAKPTVAERQGIPHHLIDCLPIDTPSFSVSLFRTLALSAVDDILARGRLPIVVGGSGLYVDAILRPLGFAVPTDAAIRARLSLEYDDSPERTFARLQACDPLSAQRLHVHDKKRVVRALEVFEASGKPLSSYGGDFAGAQMQDAQYDPIMIGLTMERDALYRRIDARVDAMLANGLLAEAERIYHAGYDRSLPAMQSIGYRQLFDYLDGTVTLTEAVERIKRDTRRFAKRQLTWFRRDARIRWFDATEWSEQTTADIIRFVKEKRQ